LFPFLFPISIVGLILSGGGLQPHVFFNNFLQAGGNEMFKTKTRIGPFGAVAALVFIACPAHAENNKTLPVVTLMRVPNRGIQPQVAVDRQGTVHMIYFHGEPANGNVFYVRMDKGKETFSPALQVNSTPGSAIAIGNIRGPQMALGKNGRVHVANSTRGSWTRRTRVLWRLCDSRAAL